MKMYVVSTRVVMSNVHKSVVGVFSSVEKAKNAAEDIMPIMNNEYPVWKELVAFDNHDFVTAYYIEEGYLRDQTEISVHVVDEE